MEDVAAMTLLSADVRIVVECVETKAEMQHRGDDDMTTTAAQTNGNTALGKEYRAIVGRPRSGRRSKRGGGEEVQLEVPAGGRVGRTMTTSYANASTSSWW